MRPIHASHRVLFQKSHANVLAKNVASTTSRDTETGLVAVGVTPHEVSKRTLVRYFLHPLYLLNVVYIMEGRREAAVNAEHLLVNDGRDG